MMEKVGLEKETAVDSIIGKTDYDYFNKDAADKYRENDSKVITQKKEFVTEESIVFEDGREMIQLSIKRPIFDEEGNVVGIVGNTVDITAQKQAEELKRENEIAEQRVQLLKTLAASIAHELRTPIAGIMHGAKGIYDHFAALLDGYEKAVKAGLIDKPIRSNRLRIIKNVVESIFNQSCRGNLIIDLLLKNISAEAIDKSEFGYCSMVTIIDNALNEYPMSSQEEHLIKWNVEEDFEFFGDPDLMQHVIWNRKRLKLVAK